MTRPFPPLRTGLALALMLCGFTYAGRGMTPEHEAKTPATTDTIYLIGSTYKAMSTFALLQQMEQGKFQLDARTGIAILSNGHRSHPHLSKIASDGLQIISEIQEN